MKSLRIVALVLCASSFAFAGDTEFRGIVRSIEHTYGVHHLRIPFLGMAMFFARPSGVHGLKMAIFEGFQSRGDSEGISHLIESSLGPDWYPFVRVRTKGKVDGETTLIYTNPSGNRMRMMIVNLEPSEAVVLKMELSEHAIEKWLKEPGEEADRSHERRQDTQEKQNLKKNEEAESSPMQAFRP